MFSSSITKKIGILTAAVCFSPALFASDGHNNHAALFVGVTNSSHGDDATLGGEYERRLPFMHGMFGVGGFGEMIFADHKAYLAGAGLIIHPWKDLKANLSFGVERTEGHTESLMRVGVAYDFHYQKMSISPTYNYDTVDGHSTNVIGVALGMGF